MVERYQFDEFELDLPKRQLRRNGEFVDLKPKAFDLLLALVENAGVLLSKDELFDLVWKDQMVEESNLTVNMSLIRKALGEKAAQPRFIATISGEGYRFVGDVKRPAPPAELQEEHPIELSDPEKLRSQPKRRVGLIAFGALAILLVAAVLAWWQINAKSNVQITLSPTMKRLTNNGKVQIAALSPDGKLFAYVVRDVQNSSLWLGYTGGGNDIQLRPPSESTYYDLVFSPDGGQLYYSIQDDQNPNGTLYHVPAFGGVPEKVREAVGSFSLSPDAKQIAYAQRSADGLNDTVMVSPLDGGEGRQVAEFLKTRLLNYDSLSWSPDGKRVAFSVLREGELYRYDLIVTEIATGKTEQLNLGGWRELGRTEWLKDGEGILATALADGTWPSAPHYEIVRIGLPGGEVTKMTSDLSSYDSSISLANKSNDLVTIEHRQLNNVWVAPSDKLSGAKQITFGSFGKYDGLWGLDWTPDGRIVFTNSDTDTQIISTMNADGSDPKELTSPGFVDSSLMVSRDGRYIVFHSNRGGYFDIWRMDASGGGLTQLTTGNQSFQPFISPDGRWVYYKCWITGVGELRRVSIDGGEPEIITDRETGLGSFSPDGKYFAATYLTDMRRIAIFSADSNKIVKQLEIAKGGVMAVMNLHWTPDSKAIVYRDSSFGYWVHPVENGEPTRLEGLPKEVLYSYAWSKDGKQFAFVRGQDIRDVVMITRK